MNRCAKNKSGGGSKHPRHGVGSEFTMVIFRAKAKVRSPEVNNGQIFPMLLNLDIFLPDALACELTCKLM